MKVIDSIVSEAASMAALRRDIHAHPELCFEERRTADLVATQLTQWGIPVDRGLGGTGVVGIAWVITVTCILRTALILGWAARGTWKRGLHGELHGHPPVPNGG